MTGKKQAVPSIPALEKALDIFEYLAGQNDYASIKDLTSNIDIPTSTAYRMVNYLVSRGYLQDHPTIEGYFFLGPRIQHLAGVFVRRFELSNIARPIMRRLASESDQTVQLGVLHGFMLTYTEQILPARPVHIIASLGTGIPVNISASGKMLVALLSDYEQRIFLENAELIQRTERSIVEVDAFRLELENVKQQGYAIDFEEYARGIGCVAAPIFNSDRTAVGAIGLTGYSSEYEGPALERNLSLLLPAADEISAALSNSLSRGPMNASISD